MMLRTVRLLLIVLDVGNWAAILFFLAMIALLALGLPPASVHVARAALPGAAPRLAQLCIAMFVVGVATGGAVDLLFRRLIAIVDTVAAARPFTHANGRRLRHIAWALLAIQLLDFAFGLVLHGINQVARHPVRIWSPSLTGWLAVLLLFVLAQVFARGAAMQDELEATV